MSEESFKRSMVAADSMLMKSEGKSLLVKVRYIIDGQESNREYTYYTEERLAVGDMAIVPVANHPEGLKAVVVAIDVPHTEIARFADAVKVIEKGAKLVPGIEIYDLKKKHQPEMIWPKGEESVEPKTAADLIPSAAIEDKRAELEHAVNVSSGSTEEESRIDDMAAEIGELEEKQSISTALTGYSPAGNQVVKKLKAEILRAVHYAIERVIKGIEDVKLATDDLVLIQSLTKSLEAERKKYTVPLNDKLREINGFFSEISTPLSEADKITRSKILEFNRKLEAEKKALEEIEAQKMEIARKEMELKGEITVDLEPSKPIPVIPQATRASLGTSSTRETWTYEVTDFKALPDEYKMPDTVLLNNTAKKYHNEKVIPGVRFYKVDSLQVRGGKVR